MFRLSARTLRIPESTDPPEETDLLNVSCSAKVSLLELRNTMLARRDVVVFQDNDVTMASPAFLPRELRRFC